MYLKVLGRIKLIAQGPDLHEISLSFRYNEAALKFQSRNEYLNKNSKIIDYTIISCYVCWSVCQRNVNGDAIMK